MFTGEISTSDQMEWQAIEDRLHQARLEFNPKDKLMNSTTDEMNSFYDEENNSFKRFNSIRGLCDQFAWNALNNHSHTFIFSTYKNWDKVVCSLSDIDHNSTYPHMCEYGS
jgi:hypothetical protein